MKRAVVTVATGQYVVGGRRLNARLKELGETHLLWTATLPSGCPTHSEVPYAFKPAALQQAVEGEVDAVLWADACIYPVQPLDRIWDHAEKYGAWIGYNGFRNDEWTADEAYNDLFAMDLRPGSPEAKLNALRHINAYIPHVVATAFALDIRHEVGRNIYDEYVRLGLTTRAFVGPWSNGPLTEPTRPGVVPRQAPCGPDSVRGHRHDQTALSLCAWNCDLELTNSPDFFAYGKVGDPVDPRTVLLADGGY